MLFLTMEELSVSGVGDSGMPLPTTTAVTRMVCFASSLSLSQALERIKEYEKAFRKEYPHSRIEHRLVSLSETSAQRSPFQLHQLREAGVQIVEELSLGEAL